MGGTEEFEGKFCVVAGVHVRLGGQLKAPILRPAQHTLLVLAIAVATRLASVLLGFVAVATLPALPVTASGWPLFNWDSLHYLAIMAHGYPPAVGAHVPRIAAFFPLYPLLARLVPVDSSEVALLLTANLAGVLAIVLFYRWARRLESERIALAATAILLIYPPSMFLAAAYTESLFLVGVLLTLLAIQEGRTWRAGAWSGIVSAVRPTGAALAATLAVWEWRREPLTRRRVLRVAALVLLASAGMLAYAVYLRGHYGSWWAYLDAQSYWGRHPPATLASATAAAPTAKLTSEGAFRLASKLAHPAAWNLAMTMAWVPICALCLRWPGRVPRVLYLLPAGVYLLGIVPDLGTRWVSLPRFEVAALPCFVRAAEFIEHPRWRWVLLVSALPLAALHGQLIWLFSRGAWCG